MGVLVEIEGQVIPSLKGIVVDKYYSSSGGD